MAFNITEFNNKWMSFKEELRTYINRAIDKDGDVMNGALLLSKDPSDDMEVVTKQYVDRYWNFIPGDKLIKNGSYMPRLSSYVSYDFTFPYNLPLGNDTNTIYSKPLADGFVKLSGTVRSPYISSIYWYGGSGSYVDLSNEIYDFKMSFSIKYQRDNCEDITVYSSPIYSNYELYNDVSHPLRTQNFEANIPVSIGVSGRLKIDVFLESSELERHSWYRLYITNPEISYDISIDNPIFTL